uniref:Uncharacterized protein n=1 Tax=Anguilla anguilla TaxID=7936 RepID=A0A0E9S2F9_ANGAN
MTVKLACSDFVHSFLIFTFDVMGSYEMLLISHYKR